LPPYITEDILSIYHGRYIRGCDGDHNYSLIILIKL
jgi:hypothetical protein